MDNRLKEAEKLGFKHAIIPKSRTKDLEGKAEFGLKIRKIGHLSELLALFNSTCDQSKVINLLKEEPNG